MDTLQQEAAQPWAALGEPINSLRGVIKSFGSHTVLKDITFDVPEGLHHRHSRAVGHREVRAPRRTSWGSCARSGARSGSTAGVAYLDELVVTAQRETGATFTSSSSWP